MKTLSIPPLLQLLVICLLSFATLWIYQSCSRSTIPVSSISIAVNPSVNISCQKSFLESDGYFCEMDSDWDRRKYIYRLQDEENMQKYPDPIYFTKIWEPNFHCTYARRIGIMGDGGKWVCDVHRMHSRDNCLIYSVGSNGEFSFEVHMKNLLPQCEIHTFDQKIYSCPNKSCIFHNVIFGDGIQPNGSKDWMTIVKSLKHQNRVIDILKIDIEGGEYAFFPLLFNAKKNLYPRQILIELHPTNITLVHGFFELLRQNNYVIFSKENNLYAGPYFFEYAFLRLNPLFFR